MSQLGFMEVLLMMFLFLAIFFFIIPAVGLWKVFTKAGKNGFAAIVPIWNTLVMLQIAGKPAYWLLLMLIPLYNIFLVWQICESIAERFGKSTGFAVGLFFLSPLFILILGFDKSVYNPNL